MLQDSDSEMVADHCPCVAHSALSSHISPAVSNKYLIWSRTAVAQLWFSAQESWPINLEGHYVIKAETFVNHHCHVPVLKRNNVKLPQLCIAKDESVRQCNSVQSIITWVSLYFPNTSHTHTTHHCSNCFRTHPYAHSIQKTLKKRTKKANV